MFQRAKIRESVRQLDMHELSEAHAAVVVLLSRIDKKRVKEAQGYRADRQVEAAVGIGGAAVVAAGLVGLSFLTFGLTGIGAAGVLAAKAAHAAGGAKMLEEAGRKANQGPARDASFLAHYEELEMRRQCLEEEIAERQNAAKRHLNQLQRAQSQRNEWSKLINDSRG